MIKIRSSCLIVFCILGLTQISYSQEKRSTSFPDGTKISDWFTNVQKVKLEDLGKQYNIADFGAVNDSTVLQTKIIQKTIDAAYENGPTARCWHARRAH